MQLRPFVPFEANLPRRMPAAIDDLRSEIARGRVLIIVGAGLSIAATRNNPVASWIGLLENAVTYCMAAVPGLSPGWETLRREQIQTGDPNELISAADLISKCLGYPAGGEYRKWLRSTVGSLEPLNPTPLEAVGSLGAPIATTNYDGLLTKVTGRPPVTWTDKALAHRWIKQDSDAILHLHGHWERPESVVLGVSSYDAVAKDEHTQAILKTCLVARTLLFVGFGAGMADPNFSALLRWAQRVLADSEYTHFRLACDRDVPSLQQEHREDRIKVLGFGDTHDSLVPFLRSLGRAPDPIILPVAPGDANLELLADRQADIQRRLSAIQSRNDSLTPADYITEIASIAFDWARIGARRSAWTLLSTPFEKHFDDLCVLDRVRLGLELSELMLVDDAARAAMTVVEKMEDDMKSSLFDSTTVARYWHLRAKCCIHLCDYQRAVGSLQKVRAVSPDPEQRATAAAELAELHLLQGEIDQALTVV